MSQMYFYPDPYPIPASLLALKKHLIEVISRVHGLLAIAFTDGDGVPLIKVAADGAPRHALRPSFLAMVSIAISRGHKMGLGKCNKMTTCYSNFQLVSFNRPPVLITLIGSSTANTGMMLNLEAELSEISETLKNIVETS
ncbi:ragulator complex protein LAMTOR3-like isoform X2 [Haemaphysalis longicornis]